MPAALIVIVVFLLLGTCAALIAGIALLFPGTPLDAMWKVKEGATTQIASMAKYLGPMLIIIAGFMLASTIGILKRRRWAWNAAVLLFLVNGLADGARILAHEVANGLTGVVMAGFFISLLVIGRRSGYFNDEEEADDEDPDVNKPDEE